MISICIPIYNYDVSLLVKELYRQASDCGVPFEILLMDDASIEEFRQINASIHLPHLDYFSLEKNIGRSKIRNALVLKSQYPYLIFMDCDSAVISNSYIADYLPYCKPGVVCYGGRTYNQEKPGVAVFLRWKYGVEREALPASPRSQSPNFNFCSNNFLIDKAVFQQVPFNESLDGYGHEDTLFGLELLGHHIPVLHIDNPLMHLGLEDADTFLKKTENGLVNLLKIEKILREKYPDIIGHSKLARSKGRLEKMHLDSIAAALYLICRRQLIRNLTGKNPSLVVFDCYRLGFLLTN